MTNAYDIRQVLFELRQQVDAVRDETEVPWDFVGDVAVTIKQEGVANEFGDLLLRAFDTRDVQLLFDILFMHASSVIDYKELGKRKYWGSSMVKATGRPDEVRFREERMREGHRLTIFQFLFTVTTLPSAYATHGRQHGWMQSTKPRTPVYQEYVVHGHWPAHWGDSSLLPRKYAVAIEATETRRQRGETSVTTWPTTGWFDIRHDYDRGEINTLALGMDFYAMWIAIEDHTTLVENLAAAHKRHAVR